MYYLRKVEVILEEKEYSGKFNPIFDKLAAEGISVRRSSNVHSIGCFAKNFYVSRWRMPKVRAFSISKICAARGDMEVSSVKSTSKARSKAASQRRHSRLRSTKFHTLLITDSASLAGEAVAEGRAVLAFLHEGNRSQDFSGVRYAFEEPEELDVEYLEQVYRRYKGIPWDILDTKRCHLRETTEADVDEFYHIYEEPLITRYMENLYPEAEQEKEYIRKYIQNVYGFYGFGVWTVIKRDTGEIIGRAGISYREGFDEPELGFVIGVPWQRQGYALEVCQAVLQYGKEQLGFTRVQALVQPNNQASLNLCAKLGMVFESMEILQKKLYMRLIKK